MTKSLLRKICTQCEENTVWLFIQWDEELGVMKMKFKGKKTFPTLLIGVCIPVILVGCSHSRKIDIPVPAKSAALQVASSVPSSSAQKNSHTVIDQTTLTASSTLTLNQTIKTTRFTICVPKSWGWKNLGDTATPMFYFNMKYDTDFGGIIYMAGYVSNESGQDTDFADYAIRSILVPNHLAVDSEEYQMTGLFTNAYLLKETRASRLLWEIQPLPTGRIYSLWIKIKRPPRNSVPTS